MISNTTGEPGPADKGNDVAADSPGRRNPLRFLRSRTGVVLGASAFVIAVAVASVVFRPDKASVYAGPSRSAAAARKATPGPLPPAKGAKPSAANTGVPAGTALKKHSGTMTISASNTVIDAMDISGSLVIKANNVTVKRTRVRCIGGDDCIHISGNGVLVQDVEAGGGADGVTNTGAGVGIVMGGDSSKGADSIRVVRANVHHTTDGLRVDGNLSVIDSYIHDPDQHDGAHGDGAQSTGYSNMVFRNNFIIGGTNAAIYLNQEKPNPGISNVVIDGNWLWGTKESAADFTSFPLYVNGGTSNVTVVNNHFNRIGYQPAFARSPGAIAQWANNTFEDSGQQISKPT